MKILATPRSFGKNNPRPYRILSENGFQVVKNPYSRPMTEDEMVKIIKDIDGIIIGIDPLNERVLRHAVKLKAISKYGVGLDNIALKAAQKKGIKLSRTVGANTNSVADFTMCLILAVARKILSVDRACRSGDWQKRMSFEVYGKTIGVLGTGKIGEAVIKRAQGFNMKILAYDLNPSESLQSEYGVEFTVLEEIYEQADIITLHLPLTTETKYLIGKQELKKMKPRAILINTARGGLVDEDALYQALKNNVIFGAGIDVFEDEPAINNKLFELDNVIVSPHYGASTYEAIDNMSLMAVKNLIKDLNLVVKGELDADS